MDGDGRAIGPASKGNEALPGSEPFVGGFLNAVDAKGRVSLPIAFRKVLATRARQLDVVGAEETALLIGEDNRFGCLRGFDGTYTRVLQDAIEAEVDTLGLGPLDRLDEVAARSMEAFGAAISTPYDGVGRMVIPAHLRSKAGITDLAFFVGVSSMVQIWSPARFEMECANRPRLIDALRAQLAERAK